ncbi:MAG: SDR family NAD(P)-dependent oxidoreductase [Xanthobacteraceae bacterium]
MSASTANRGAHVAIVGLACRFPKAANVGEFWSNLANARDCISRFTEAERESPGGIDDRSSRALRVLAHGAVENIDLFDAQLFGFSANEATITDPQQRLSLEVAWQCMLDAGLSPRLSTASVGVFTSSSSSSYLINELLPRPERNMSAGGATLLIRNDKDHTASLIAYKLGFTGPALNVGCGCSGGLAAVHLGVQHLRTWQCDVALCGAASILVPQKQGHLVFANGIYSHDGYCRVFDQSATGTVGGAGVGFLALKRLEDAVRDGDRIYATIIGSAMNNDGNAKVGYTAPSLDQQAAAVVMAHSVSDVSGDTITMLEAHGTGTIMGDPIEVRALTRAFSHSTEERSFCAIGSVKSNIGHADVAAGVAGLIKTALALKHAVIPATLHCSQPNPQLCLDESPFYINTSARRWEPRRGVRRAGVNSLGMGGTNVHVVLEEYAQQPEAPVWTSDCYIFLMSAHTQEALNRWEASLQSFVSADAALDAGSLAYTLAMRRPSMKVRSSVVASDASELQERLASLGSLPAQQPRARFVLVLGPGASGTALPPAFMTHGCAYQIERLELAAVKAGHRAVAGISMQALACAAWFRQMGMRFDAVVGLGPTTLAALVASAAMDMNDATRRLVAGDLALSADELRERRRGNEVPVFLSDIRSADAVNRADLRDFWESLSREWHEETSDGTDLYIFDPFNAYGSAAQIQAAARVTGAARLIGAASIGSRDMLDAIAAIWRSGIELDWRCLYPPPTRRWIDLPEYPLQRQRYWIGSAVSDSAPRVDDPVTLARERYGEYSRPPHFVPLASHQGLEQGLDDLCRLAFARFVGPLADDPEVDASQLAIRLGVHLRHRRFFGSLWRRFAQQPLPVSELHPAADALKARYPAFSPLIELLRALGEALPVNMTEPVEAAYGFNEALNDGTLQRILSMRPAFSNVEACCRAAASVATQLAEQRDARPLRILEVGAGRMIFTQFMEELIRAGRVEYWITDVNGDVVKKAAHLAETRGLKVHTGVIDITRPLEDQNPDAVGFDVIVALNVLHVCSKVDIALGNLRAGLADGGRLMIMEAVSDPLWMTFIWGWSEGWWNFDAGERTDSPLMGREAWRAALDRLRPSATVEFHEDHGGDTALWVSRFDEAARPHTQSSSVAALTERETSPDEWLHKPCFVRQPRPNRGVPASRGTWIALVDSEQERPDPLLADFRREFRVISVYPGSSFARLGETSYRVNPTSLDDLRAFFIAVRDELPERFDILFSWRLSQEGEREGIPENHRRFYSMLALARAIGEEVAGKCAITVLTRGLHFVTGAERLEPLEALVAAAAKIVPREYWNCTCRVIDVDDRDALGAETRTMIKGLATAPDGPPSLAVRGGSHWIPWYSPVSVLHAQAVPQRLRREGSYVIFGGLGGLGFSIARFLAEHFAARLLLVGRSADAADPHTAAKVDEIRRLGGECGVFAADVTVAADVDAALAEAEQSFGAIHGLVHSAGEIDGGGVIHTRTVEQTAANLAPKVLGPQVLAAAIGSRAIDFFVMFSSIGSTLYKLKFGEVGYVAGNDFLVSFAQALARDAHYFVQVIQWTDWDDVGMWSRARSAMRSNYTTRSGQGDGLAADLLRPLTYEEGISLFARALQTDEPHLLVSVRPLEMLLRLHDQYQSTEYGPYLDRLGLARRSPEPADTASELPDPAEKGIGVLRSIWEEVIGCKVEHDSDFFALGGDSLLALRVISRVAEEYKVSLPLSAFFSSSTLQDMYTYVDNLRWAAAEQNSV